MGKGAGSGIQITRLEGQILNLVIGFVVVRTESTIGPNEELINERLAPLKKIKI